MAKISRLEKPLAANNTGLVLFDALNGYLHPADPEKQAFLDVTTSCRTSSVSLMVRAVPGL